MASIQEQFDIIATVEATAARRICTDVWLTKDGRAIEVKKMEDTHLLKTIGLLIKNTAYNQQVHAMRMMNYANSGPDGAAAAADEEATQLMEASRDDIILATGKNFPVIHTMAGEVIKRGLDWVPTVEESIIKGRLMFDAQLAKALAKKNGITLTAKALVADEGAMRQMDNNMGDMSDVSLF